jgi:hypothetical protein
MDSREAYLKSGREPEENEMLSVALAYASHGVQGFTFYSYFDLSRGPFPEWYEKRWEKVVRVAAALRSLEPFILSGYRPRELPHQDGCDRTRIVIMADGKKNYRVLAIGLGAKHETSFTLPKKVGRLTSRCGRTTEKNGVYTFTGPAFSCDILEAPDHR